MRGFYFLAFIAVLVIAFTFMLRGSGENNSFGNVSTGIQKSVHKKNVSTKKTNTGLLTMKLLISDSKGSKLGIFEITQGEVVITERWDGANPDPSTGLDRIHRGLVKYQGIHYKGPGSKKFSTGLEVVNFQSPSFFEKFKQQLAEQYDYLVERVD